jgi:hypothetical protein
LVSTADRAAFHPRALGLDDALDLRIIDPAGHVGGDGDRTGEVEQLDPGEPP